MKRRFDYLYAIILVLLLVTACLINNPIIRGIALLLFSGVLVYNMIMKLKLNQSDKFSVKFFLGILLFVDVLLALEAIFIIVTALVG